MKFERVERIFLVRLWREAHPATRQEWRGCVQDVTLGTVRYISVPQEIADYVAARLAAGDEAPLDEGKT
jgi:hypothetical protein